MRFLMGLLFALMPAVLTGGLLGYLISPAVGVVVFLFFFCLGVSVCFNGRNE